MGLLSDRKYGRLLIGSTYIAAFFGGAFLFVVVFSWSLLVTDNDTLLTKIGTMTSIGGMFLGTYIAVWLINQNRTRRIEENYFYKISFLADMEGVISTMYLLFRAIEDARESEKIHDEKTTELQEQNVRIDEKTSTEIITELQEQGRIHFKYYIDQIKIINSNILIPVHTRAAVKILVEQGNKSLVFDLGRSGGLDVLIKDTLILSLNDVIDTGYFIKDQDKYVQNMLKDVKTSQQRIENMINVED